MNRRWSISLTLACVMLASTFAWAKDQRHKNEANRGRQGVPHNPQPKVPHFPNSGNNQGKPQPPKVVEPSTPKVSPPPVSEPKVSEPKLAEPKVGEPAGGDSRTAHVNGAEVSRPGEPKMGMAERLRPGEGLNRLKDMTPEEQLKALNSDPEFQKLPPEQKQRLHEQLEKFNQLPQEQKERLIQRMRQWATLTPEQKEQARLLQEKLRSVPEDRRKMMQTALRSLRQMDPEERERVINSDRFKSMFSDNERDILRGVANLPIGKQPEK